MSFDEELLQWIRQKLSIGSLPYHDSKVFHKESDLHINTLQDSKPNLKKWFGICLLKLWSKKASANYKTADAYLEEFSKACEDFAAEQ